MTRIDLNIVDRGTQGTAWVAEGAALTAADLNNVVEQKSDNSAALNSLPTPFARFYAAREAFRRVHTEHLDPTKEAGSAYRRIVSDILDVYELLFNLAYHKACTFRHGERLELRRWDSKPNLEAIKTAMPRLHNSLAEYYDSDIATDRLHFLILTERGKDQLLAATSPITGFVTPPDLDRTGSGSDAEPAGEGYRGLHIRGKGGGEYFRDLRLFADRDADFKNYMHNTLFGGAADGNTAGRMLCIREYIRGFGNDPDIRADYPSRLRPVCDDQNDALTVAGLAIMQNDEVDINSYFADVLVRVPYRINGDSFTAVTYQNDTRSRDYDYLLPFRPEVMDICENGRLDADVHINRNSVTVHIRHNGTDYKRDYSPDPHSGQGCIVDLGLERKNVSMALFPNILSARSEENDYFKLMLVTADSDEAPQMSIDDCSLRFYRLTADGLEAIEEAHEGDGAMFGARPAFVRSRSDEEDGMSGTKFYEVFGTTFDVIEVRVGDAAGLLLPVWRRAAATSDTYTYAIDLGTSNTFLTRCKNTATGQPDLSERPQLFTTEGQMVSYTHEASAKKQYSLPRRIEEAAFSEAHEAISTEFAPAAIDGHDYRFPIRTALCAVRGQDAPSLFDTHNIAFFCGKRMAKPGQDVLTDIKWETREEVLRVFIRELLLIIKSDILRLGGDLGRTRLVWFSPLSFMGKARQMYERVWEEEATGVLRVGKERLCRYSESEAPYYYYKKMDYIRDSASATVIDIGGGSTDFVYFRDNEPVVAASVHFGCDVLWENGFCEFANIRENGIYKRYAGKLRFKGEELDTLSRSMELDTRTTTKDIIALWLANAGSCGITPLLSNDFKPVFVYHLTAILFYMASMYKERGLEPPRTILFSGNGSRYIDSFISADTAVAKRIIDMTLSRVFGCECDTCLFMPPERKESTCYGGLYREPAAPPVQGAVYQGDMSREYTTVGDINRDFPALRKALVGKYKSLARLYSDVLDMLRREGVLDGTLSTAQHEEAAHADMRAALDTYYKKQVRERYDEAVAYNDSVFFLPIIDTVFKMTQL